MLFIKMNVFVLSTGRSGSSSFKKACEYIDNFTVSQESLVKKTHADRLDYPDNHIEVDNRLSWFLGSLDKKYGDEAFYVKLKRDPEKIASSLAKRFRSPISLSTAFTSGILKRLFYLNTPEQRLDMCAFLVTTVHDNIDLFMKDKSNTMEISLENMEEDFETFWHAIGAQGDLDKALNIFKSPVNESKNIKTSVLWTLKLFFYRQLFYLRK